MTTYISSKSRPHRSTKQSGVTTVEFAIVGLVALTILFGCIEVSRLMFTANMLEEATRRGARVAAVCAINSPVIAQTAVFNSAGGGTSPVVSNLAIDNIQVEYLNEAGDTIENPVLGGTGATIIAFVRVQIINYQHEMIIPGLNPAIASFTSRGYTTTIPSESLGSAPFGQTSSC